MKRCITISIFLFAAAFLRPAVADDLNSVVNVTKTYEASLESRVMPTIPVFIPDSAKVFRLGVDYDFMESEYKGTGDPSQFLTEMKISPVIPSRPNCLYVRGALGYTLAPEVDVYWCPVLPKKGWNFGVFASNRSYIGPYWSFDGLRLAGKAFSGYDVHTRAAVGASYDWNSGTVGLQAQVGNIVAGCDTLSNSKLPRRTTSLAVNVFVRSRHNLDRKPVYDFNVAYKSVLDREFGEYEAAIERNLCFSGSVGGVIKDRHSIMVDAHSNYIATFNNIRSRACTFDAIPHYNFTGKFWNLSLGVKFAGALNQKEDIGIASYSASKNQIFYPDVKAGIYLFHKTACAAFSVTGGITPVTWSSLIENNHWISTSYYGWSGAGLLDYEICRVKAGLDFKGNIHTKFFYRIGGGYAMMANAPVESCTPDMLHPILAWGKYSTAWASADAGWHWNSLNIDAKFKYTWSDIDFALKLPDFQAGLSARYTYYKRISAWLGADWVSSRQGLGMKLPGYVNLYAGCEYKYSSELSFFIKGDNLMAQALQEHPLVARKGVCVLLGVIFSL